MNEIILILNKVLPIVFFLALGYWIHRKHIFKPQTVQDLKKLIVNFALPSVLFLSFLETTIDTSAIFLLVLIFSICVALYFMGVLIRKYSKINGTYTPFLFTGFEFGMLGIGLFGSAYGLENVGPMAVIGVGHEFFIWFIYLTLLLREKAENTSIGSLLKSFITSPIIIAIVLSISLNLFGLTNWLQGLFFSEALFSSLNSLAGLTGVLILIIVGYEIKIDRSLLTPSIKVTAIRLGLLIPSALLISEFLLKRTLHLSTSFQAAIFTILILPPPFILPLYMKEGSGEERSFINNTLMLHTLASIVVFVIYFAIHPTI